MSAKIELRNFSLTFQSFGRQVVALRDVSLSVEAGEFVTIIGPSGCGKSTLLNVIAGLVDDSQADFAGTVTINKDGQNSGLGFVFQSDTLLPWRNVADNIGVGLEVRGVQRRERTAQISELIKLVGLAGFEESLPHQLSGGMRQRVSIARALAYDPGVVLMDEPFGALDAQTRMILQQELLSLWGRTHKTILFVTHDLSEAVALGQRVILMTARPGRIREIYPVDVPYPRAILQLAARPDYNEAYQRIWKVLSQEIQDVMLHEK